MKKVNEEISGFTWRGGIYAKGLASEGYNGGYRDALNDVLLALNGVKPNRQNWWDKDVKERGMGRQLNNIDDLSDITDSVIEGEEGLRNDDYGVLYRPIAKRRLKKRNGIRIEL